MADITDKVKEIIAEKLGKDIGTISGESRFIEDLGADSLDTVEFIMELEDTFHINIPDEDAEKLKTVQEAINYINEHNGSIQASSNSQNSPSTNE